jgi:hypothetical protein
MNNNKNPRIVLKESTKKKLDKLKKFKSETYDEVIQELL